MSFFTVNDLHAGYCRKRVLDGVSFSVEEGSLMGVLGANGSGKTTLLKSICGIIPHCGSCTLDGDRLEGMRERELGRICSYIAQRSGIGIDISALDVVLMGFNPQLGLLERPNREMHRCAMAALEKVGLGGKENENYLFLSEGQKQLCMLARTIAADGKMLLLDEPESALDFYRRYRMLEIIRGWIGAGNRCGIMALHDPVLALNMCDRILLLKNGKVLDLLSPASDSLERMKGALESIYGSISLHRIPDRSGREQIVLIREDE